MKRSNSRNQSNNINNQQPQVTTGGNLFNNQQKLDQQLNFENANSRLEKMGGISQNLRFNQTTNPTQEIGASQNYQLQKQGNNTGCLAFNARQQMGIQNSRQLGGDLFKASTQHREEIRELMGQIDMPDDSLTMSSLSQSPWNIKSRQRMSQTNGTNDASNSNDNEGTLVGGLEGTYEENKSLSITRRQNQTSYVEDLGDGDSQNQTAQEYDESQSQLMDQDQTQSDIDHSRLDNFKRRIAGSPDELQDSQLEKSRNSPDFNRRQGSTDNMNDDLTISNTVISNTNTTSYRGAIMTENQNSRRVQNRTFADSVINQGYNQLTSSSNNNTYRNNYSSNQETHRNSGRNRLTNNNKTTAAVGKSSKLVGRHKRVNHDATTSDDNIMMRSDDEDESESEDINRRIQEQSDDDYDDEVSPPPNQRSRDRSNNQNRRQNLHQDDEHDMSSSAISDLNSFTQTQYSKFSYMGKSKLLAKHKGEDIDLTELDQASMIGKSPIQRFKNMANEESLSLTPASIEGKWKHQNSHIGGNKAINRTLAVSGLDIQNPLNKLTTNLNSILANNQNVNTLNMTDMGGSRASYNATQVLFGNKNLSHNNNHHSSIQRDQELEQALEEDSQNQTINQNNLTNSGSKNSDPPLRTSQYTGINQGGAQIDFRKIKYENTQLQIELRKAFTNVKDLAEQLETSDMQRNQLKDFARDLEYQVNDLKEHLMLLKQQCNDDSQLPKLRGKLLEQAKVENKNLTKTLSKKDQQIQQLEQLLQAQDKEDNITCNVLNDEIQKLIKEIETQKILNEAIKKENKGGREDVKKAKNDQHQLRQQFQREQEKLKESYDQWFQQVKVEFEQGKQEQQKVIKELEKQIKQLDKQMRVKEQHIEEDQSIIDQKDQIIKEIERDHERLAQELANYKERCKDQETELDHIRGGSLDQNSMFGGNQSVSYAGKVNTTLNQTRNNYDFEVKKMKDVFTQQLNKTKEESSKYRTQVKDLESKVKFLEEETSKKYQQSISQTSEQIEKDQKIINELQKTNNKLNQYISQEADIRDIFNIDNQEDLYQKLLIVREDQEMKVLLETEHHKLQNQLREAQQRELELIENQNKLIQSQKATHTNKSSDSMSNFTKTLLMNKDKEIDNLKAQFEREKQGKQDLDDQLWKLQNDLKSQQLTNQELELQVQELSKEITKIRENKDKSDRNVDELKEKLRVMIREQQENSMLLKQATSQPKVDDIERKKYEELITMILELDMAQDPLAQVNLSLQESFIDEFEQARKHLEEQQRLVEVMIDEKNKEVQSKTDQFKSISEEIKTHLSTIESQKREVFRLQDQVKEKERHLEIIATEQEELHKTCERLSIQLREVEELNCRLRAENEEINLNFRKLMRAQEHLHKGDKSKINTQVGKSSNQATIELSEHAKLFQQIDIDRLTMMYEDQLSKALRSINSLKTNLSTYKQSQSHAQQDKSNTSFIREQQREEVIEMLDQLIESNTKQLTFNDLGMKLAKRLDKVRLQERVRYQSIHSQGNEVNNNLKSSHISLQENELLKSSAANFGNPSQNNQKSMSGIVENFKQEIDQVNNENELLHSINKWLKESGNNLQQQQNQFRNFFTNDDQNSLMLSELITNKNEAKPAINTISALDQEQMRQKDEFIKDLQLKIENNSQEMIVQSEEITKLQQKLHLLNEELILKDQALRESEGAFHNKFRELESDQKNRNQSMWKEVESLKDQIKLELQAKTDQLDAEYEELEKQKARHKQQMLEQQKEQERQFMQKLESQEREFRDKLKLIENDIKNGCEQSKEEQITGLCKQLEEQYQTRLKSQSDEMQQQIQLLKAEHSSKLEELKRQKERDVKKSKDELEKLKKTYEDKLKKLEQEQATEKECWDRQQKEKIEQIVQKQKKDIKAAQDKLRAEHRNQVDSVKNDMVKQKAEFEREKKKLIQEHESGIEQMKREFEEVVEKEIKITKEKQEKVMKRKLDEKQSENVQKLEEMENEIALIRNSHQIEIKKEKERLELRLRDQLRADLRLELHDELELEFQEQLDRIRTQQQLELDKLKSKYEVIMREERARMLPIKENEFNSLKQSETRNTEVQCDLLTIDSQQILSKAYTTTLSSQANANKQPFNYTQASYINTSSKQDNSQQNSIILNNSQLYIDQLKQNFEEELERQQQLFELQLTQKQNASVKVFEELMVLEFDKILQSIYFKAQQNQNQIDLDRKRNEINKLIADILNRNDCRKDKQMRLSLENLKKKISETLKVFKAELENKLNKKQDQMVKEQVLKERLRLHNISDIVSMSQRQSQQDNLLSGDRCSQQQSYSDMQSEHSYNQNFNEDLRSEYYSSNINKEVVDSRPNSQLPTPRNILDQNKQENQLSDVKKYSQEQEQDNNILKKISPVVNQNGVLVVEVDKVVRDLKMLHQTIKIAKFYRALLPVDEISQKSQTEDQLEVRSENQDSDTTLQQYRVLLNNLFKLIAKMNQGVDIMNKQSEVYKLKLLNTELKEKIAKFENDDNRHDAAIQVEEILNLFQKNINKLSEPSQRCLNILETTQFSINKLQLKLFQLIDLFSDSNSQINNSDLVQIDEKCSSYLEQNPNDQVQLDQLLQSTIGGHGALQQTMKICPELLSPEETAQLVANVFQRLNQTTGGGSSNNQQQFLSTKLNNKNQTHNVIGNQLDSYQSFFNTFLSNDENVKSAENFIKKYREQINFTQNHVQGRINRSNTSAHNLPLQMVSQDMINVNRYNQTSGQGSTQHRQYQSVQIGTLNHLKKRSRSQSNTQNQQNHNQSAFTSYPTYNYQFQTQMQNLNQTNLLCNPSQTYVSNIFQKGCSEHGQQNNRSLNNNMHSISIHTQNPSLLQPSSNENINCMNIQQNQSQPQLFGLNYSNSNNNILVSNYDTLSQNNNNPVDSQSMFTRTAGGVSQVSQSYNGNPWRQTQQQQQHQHQSNQHSSLSNPSFVMNNQTQAKFQNRSGSLTANKSVDEVSQAQNSVNALFQKLKTNYQHNISGGAFNATKNQSFN
eukprot:403373188